VSAPRAKFSIDDEQRVICDVDTLIDTRMLVQSNSGGGKSWAVRRILESTHGKVQHLVLDPQGEAAVLRVLIDAYPAGPTREDVSAATGFKRSTRDAYLSRLSTRKLAVALRGGQVQASKLLFDA
jgi:DNA helicase HerA-like ATPase